MQSNLPGPPVTEISSDFDLRKAEYQLRREQEARISSQRPRKDRWDKAAIVSSFLSSFLLAIVGLALTWSLQKGQIESTERLAMTRQEDERLRNAAATEIERARLANQVLDAAASQSEARRSLAVQLMADVMPADQFDRLALVMAHSDPSAVVRELALAKLGESSDPGTLKALREMSSDPTRTVGERMSAEQAALRVSVRAGLRRNSFFLGAAGIDGLAYEDREGGHFSRFLLSAFDGNADYSGDGLLSAAELSEFLRFEVNRRFGNQHPLYVFTGPGSSVVDPGAPEFSRVVAVAVGLSDYADPTMRLVSARKDAEKIVEMLRVRVGSRLSVTPLYDNGANREAVLGALEAAASLADKESLLLVYFSGHGVNRSGEPAWVLYESSRDASQELIELPVLKKILRRSKAMRTLVLIDSCAALPVQAPRPAVAGS
jgi:hypothetical protein